MEPTFCIVGYYAENKDDFNYGDELFRDAFKYILPGKLVFVSIDHKKSLKELQKELNLEFKAIVLGGGDVINDFFIDKFLKLTHGLNVPKHIIGCGIPYVSYLVENKEKLNLFSHIFTRTFNSLCDLSKICPARFSHFLPDLVFSLPVIKNENKNLKKKIGFFPVGSVILENKLLYRDLLAYFVNLLKKYDVIVFPFDKSIKKKTSDLPFVNEFVNKIKKEHKLDNLSIYDSDIESTKHEIASLDGAITMRFHAHVLCTLYNVPFLSYSTTNKVADLLSQINIKPLTGFEDLKSMDKLLEDPIELNKVKEKLKSYTEISKLLLDTKQIEKLITKVKPCIGAESININAIYEEGRQEILKNFGYDIKKDRDFKLPHDFCNKLGDQILFKITHISGSKYLFGMTENLMVKSWELKDMIRWVVKDLYDQNIRNSIDMSYFDQEGFKGVHRAGWQYVVSHMKSLDMGVKGSILVDTYLDKTFGWGFKALEESGVLPYSNQWIGFFHHTDLQNYSPNNLSHCFNNKLFLQSLPTCKCIIVLSEYLAKYIRSKFPKLRVEVLFHPTLLIRPLFNTKDYSYKLVQIGSWYRQPWALWEVDYKHKYALKGHPHDMNYPPPEFTLDKKTISTFDMYTNKWLYYFGQYLLKLNLPDNFKIEYKHSSYEFTNISEEVECKLLETINSVKIIDRLDNKDYDKLFSTCCIFLNLLDCSAANTIIECIASCTPILVNRMEAIEQYLQKDYPLFYNKLEDIPLLLTYENVQKAHLYLKNLDKNFLNIDTFLIGLEEIINKC